MAEGIDGKGLDKLEGEITCGICQEHYTEPKVLPCLHYYCKECISRLAAKAGDGKPFWCPECRSETKLPEGGVDGLKTAFFVNRLKTTITSMERTQGKVEVFCELCSLGDKAIAFCRQCAMFICDSCVKQHKIIKIFASHEIALLEDLKQRKAQSIVTKDQTVSLKCEDHGEPLIIYCFDCKTLICHHCTVKDHRDHNFEFCRKAAMSTKKELLDKLQPLKDQASVLSKVSKDVDLNRDKVENLGLELSDTITTSFKRLHEILDKREEELLAEASELVEDKMSKLTVQGKNLSLAHAEICGVIEYTERCVEHCTDSEVMSMVTEIQQRIEHEMEQCDLQTNMAPVEEANIAVDVRCEEALLQLVQTQATVTDVFPMDATKCTLTMDNAVVEVGVQNKVTLTLKDTNGKILANLSKVFCSVKSLCDQVITKCEIDEVPGGSYTFKYKPTVRGRHEVTVCVDEVTLDNTFPFIVSVSPTAIREPLKVWKLLSYGIAIDSTGDVLVAGSNNKILKLPHKGQKTVLMQHDLWTFRKIDVDKDGNIYGISGQMTKENRMLKCDHAGNNMRYYDLEHVEGALRGLAVVGDEVLVSSTQTGVVTVHDRKLNYTREIKHNMGMILAICSDGNGTLFFADFTNNCVHSFTIDGTFLRTFGESKIENPWGMCVSGQCVYVCNNGSKSLAVFTCEGAYVTSVDVTHRPHSVCADRDGFLCVTGKEVQVF